MILILAQCFPSRLGGIESLISNLALGLAKTEKVTVFADSYNIFYDTIFDNKYKNEILIKRIGGIKYFRRRKKIRELKSFIKLKKINYVIGDSWKSLELGIDYLNLKNIPTICLAHGNELLSENIVKIKRIKKTLQKTSLVIANSKYTKNLLLSLDISDIKIDYVYPGAIDLRNDNSTELDNIKGNPTILTLARLEKRKGHFHVIESVKKLSIRYPQIKYIIAGEGSEKNNLIKQVSDNNLNHNIVFVGKINDLQKKFLFEKTDLMIMPTIDQTKKSSIEGFGISYIEAAFFSIPSITSNVGGTPEAVLNNLTGIVIDEIEMLHDSILDLLKNKEKISKLGQAARDRAIKDFNWETVTLNYLSLLKKHNII